MDDFWKLIAKTARIDPAGRRAVRRQVTTALSTGWTPEALAAWVSRQLRSARERGKVGNPGGFVVSQLKEIPQPSEIRDPEDSTKRAAASLPACDLCGAREGTPKAQRMVHTDDGRLRHCDCAQVGSPVKNDQVDGEPKPAPRLAQRPQPGADDDQTSGHQVGSVQADNPLEMAGLAS